jgi:hypothetical protein
LALPEKYRNAFFRFFLSSSIFNEVPRFILQFFLECLCGSAFVNYSSDSNPRVSLNQLKMCLIVPLLRNQVIISSPRQFSKKWNHKLFNVRQSKSVNEGKRQRSSDDRISVAWWVFGKRDVNSPSDCAWEYQILACNSFSMNS